MAQVGLLGAQEPAVAPEDEAVENKEKILFGCLVPHLGHSIVSSLSLSPRLSSNFSPHLVHSYS